MVHSPHAAPPYASAVVTGDAVVLDLRLAKLPSRGLAQLLDALLQLAALFVVGMVVGVLSTALDEAALAAVGLLLSLGVLLGYPLISETLSRGYTLGKWALGLRAVRDDGGPIRFRHALVRALLEVVEIWMLASVSVIASMSSRRGKRVGDLLAGTVVIRERAPVRPLGPVSPPLGAEGWAAGLDLSALSQRDALQGRQLLGRWGQMDTGARGALAEALATRVRESVHPEPPPGTPPATYVAAVLAERHRRELVRLQAASAVQQPTYGPPPGDYGRPSF